MSDYTEILITAGPHRGTIGQLLIARVRRCWCPSTEGHTHVPAVPVLQYTIRTTAGDVDCFATSAVVLSCGHLERTAHRCQACLYTGTTRYD